MKPIKYLLLLVFFISSNISAQNTFLWRIESPKSSKVSYLNGTNHTLTSTYTDNFPIIREKISSADVVVFETNLDQNEITKYYESKPINEELKKILNEEQLQKLSEKYTDRAIKSSPTMVYMLLSGVFSLSEPDSTKIKSGKVMIETYLKDLAIQEQKPIIGLESVTYQLEAVDRMKPSFLVYGLMKKSIPGMVDDMDNPDKKFTRKKEVEKNVEEYYEQETKYYLNNKCRGQFYQNLLVDRNNNWVEKLPEILDTKNAFISVGALHLKYKCGLVSQLMKAGYKLTPIDMKTGKDLPFETK